MVQFAQHRLRQRSLLLALSPPFGYSLSLEMTDRGTVGLRLDRNNYVDLLHHWSQFVSAELAVDPNNGAYPVPLLPDTMLITYLPLHPSQNSNLDATLKHDKSTGLYTLIIPLLQDFSLSPSLCVLLNPLLYPKIYPYSHFLFIRSRKIQSKGASWALELNIDGSGVEDPMTRRSFRPGYRPYPDLDMKFL